MRNIVEYKDLLAFHPGYYIAETIEDMGMTQGEFATRMGTTPKTLSKLVNGQANITNDLAQKLSTMLGTSPDVWLNLQTAYDNKLIEIQQAKDLDAQKEIIDQIDYNFFKMVAGLPIVHSWKEKLLELSVRGAFFCPPGTCCEQKQPPAMSAPPGAAFDKCITASTLR
ncbi:MAG: HigA family addiction module antitoxin [Lachnospiraceae bacterium]